MKNIFSLTGTKWFLFTSCILLAGILIGIFLGYAISAPKKVGISQVTVSKQVIDDHDVLIVDNPEGSYFGQLELLSTEFDYDRYTISIVEYRTLFHPGFRGSIHSRWPVVIRNGLLSGDYTLQFWNGERFTPVGKVIAGTNTIQYVPVDKGTSN
jgi:hypothetical protein